MKIGTFLLLFLAVGGYLLWKYSGHLKRLFAASATPSGTAKSVKDLIAKYALSILLVVVGLVVFFQGVYSSEWQSPSFARVASWSWNHWLQLLVLWGIGSALLALNKKELGAAVPVLQSLFTGIVVMAFLVCPVIGWFEGSATQRPATAQAPAQTICPDVTSRETRECLITNEWSNWIRLADGARDNGNKICHSLGVESERMDNGATLIRFKTSNGHSVVKYRLYPINTSCSIEGF